MRQGSVCLIFGALLGISSGTPSAAESADPEGAPLENALLEVDEATGLLADPEDGAKEIVQLAAGTRLVLITHKQHGAYRRVIRIGHGPSGWVHSGTTTFLRGKDDKDPDAAAIERKKCAESLDSCPAEGCGGEDAVANARKRRIPKEGTPVALAFDDYARLQEQADERVGQGKPELDEEGLAKLAALELDSGPIALGALVRTYGYIPKGGPGLHVNGHGESVNCNLKKPADNDFHIPLVGRPDDTEFKGIVVEMIPQKRPDNWSIEALETARDEGREVWVEGALFYDKEHYVSDDPDNELKNDPNRASLWEIHPITKFLVCRKDSCARDNEQDWEEL